MAVTLRLMSRRALLRAAAAVCVSLALFALRAEARAPGDKLTLIEAVLTVNADRTAELVEKRRITILATGGIRPAGQQVATWIEGMETLDVVEAYTQKGDGRRIDVEPNRMFRRDAASDDNGGYLTDQKALTVVYPDLSIGDIVVLTTKLTIKAGSFPGHLVTQFMHSSEVKDDAPGFKVTLADSPRAIPDAGSTYRIVVPRGMPVHVEIAGEGIAKTVTEDEASTTYVATFGERVDAKDKSRSAVEQGPRIFVSTLRDYEELGEAYWAAAAPHVEVTPAIQAMADEITKSIEDRRQQAEAISLWVKRNIRYIIIHQGIGRDLSIVPADTVLRNRYGECKEHAVLMSALLAAKKIDSELVLIQLGDITSIPETPTLAFFNHLIVYLPEFDMLDDPTSATTPFGSLAKEGRNKPVVVMSQRGARVAKSPPPAP